MIAFLLLFVALERLIHPGLIVEREKAFPERKIHPGDTPPTPVNDS